MGEPRIAGCVAGASLIFSTLSQQWPLRLRSQLRILLESISAPTGWAELVPAVATPSPTPQATQVKLSFNYHFLLITRADYAIFSNGGEKKS